MVIVKHICLRGLSSAMYTEQRFYELMTLPSKTTSYAQNSILPLQFLISWFRYSGSNNVSYDSNPFFRYTCDWPGSVALHMAEYDLSQWNITFVLSLADNFFQTLNKNVKKVTANSDTNVLDMINIGKVIWQGHNTKFFGCIHSYIILRLDQSTKCCACQISMVLSNAIKDVIRAGSSTSLKNAVYFLSVGFASGLWIILHGPRYLIP